MPPSRFLLRLLCLSRKISLLYYLVQVGCCHLAVNLITLSVYHIVFYGVTEAPENPPENILQFLEMGSPVLSHGWPRPLSLAIP